MRVVNIIFVGLGLLVAMSGVLAAQDTFSEFCTKEYVSSGQCPAQLCELSCLGSQKNMTQTQCEAEGNKLLFCKPRACETMSVENCAKLFCEVVTNCAKEQLCQPKVPSDQVPGCGGLAYNGQDVQCCNGLIKRCGFDYLDGSCNMTGKNTPYHLPLCIPCGDGVCGNFENHCNCPEDCKKVLIPLSAS